MDKWKSIDSLPSPDHVRGQLQSAAEPPVALRSPLEAPRLEDAQLQTISHGLAAAILLFGFSTLCFTTWLIVRSYSPYPFWDHWDIIGELLRSHRRITLLGLWAQHNEHRLFVGRLLCYADLFLLGGRNVGLLAATWLNQLTLLTLLVVSTVRWGRVSLPVALTLIGLAAYACFSPLQTENFAWAFQATFVPATTAACLSFAALIWGYHPASPNHKATLGLALSILFALIAEATVASGLLTWPLLLLLSFALRMRRRQITTVAVAGTVAIFAYLRHYRSPVGHSRPIDSLQHPLMLLKFVLTELAESWTAHLPNASLWPVEAESFAFLGIALVLSCVLLIVFRPDQSDRFALFALTCQLFCLGAVFMTALGRLRFGYDQALAGRYQCFVLVFWWCSAAVVARLLERTAVFRPGILAFQAVCLMMLLAVAARFNDEANWAFGLQQGVAKAWNALSRNTKQDSEIVGIYYDPRLLRTYFTYMQSQHWAPNAPARELGFVEPAQGTPRPLGLRLAGPEACSGFIDSSENLEQETNFELKGWAWDKVTRQPPREVIIVSSKGTVVGKKTQSTLRPDVSASQVGVTSQLTGWVVNLSNTNPDVYRAFAVGADGVSVCPLQNEFVAARAK